MSGRRRDFIRLPTTVIPQRYDLTFKFNFQAFTYIGMQIVEVTVTEATKSILLNASELQIQSIIYKPKTQAAIEAAELKVSEETECMKITFETEIKPGEGELHLLFEGQLNDKMQGLHRCKYTTTDGSIKYGAVSRFEATNTRKAFPCWDEPILKAKFDIKTVIPRQMMALSNMQEIWSKDDQDPNFKVVKFETTPKMSTYLIALAIGEYSFIEAISNEGTKVRVYTPLTKVEEGKFAMDVTLKALTFYKDYFNIAYPLPKLDLIGVTDFSVSSMENWGLIIFRESCLLHKVNCTSNERKLFIARSVCIEVAHQWFGNLVTMKWWTYLWLNEGFALFVQCVCLNSVYPEFDIWTQFLTNNMHKAADLDALHNSHPIEVNINHPSEVDDTFDSMSVDKGASIIRMLCSFLGETDFKKGLNIYLTKYAYGCSSSDDLWNALEEVCRKPIATIMNTWTKQKGFPLISVSSKQEGNNRRIRFDQKKFAANGKLSESDRASIWFVPISLIATANPSEEAVKMLLDAPRVEIILEDMKPSNWIKVNPSTVCFYRVQYSLEMLLQLLPAIKDKTLPPFDRLDLLNDLFAAVQAGTASTIEMLKMMEAFVNEDNYTVWNSINTSLGKLNALLSHTDFQELFHTYGRKLLANIYIKLGWDAMNNESPLQSSLRYLVIRRLTSFEDPNVIEEAKKRFEASISGSYIIPQDIRSAVYRSVATDCDEKTFDLLRELYRKTDSAEDKSAIATALGCVRDPVKIQKLLALSMSDEVKSHDTVFIIISVALTKNGRKAAWKFLQERYNDLYQRYSSTQLMSYLVKHCTENFASEDMATEVLEFFSRNPHQGMERTVQQSVEAITLNAEWLARDSMIIKTYICAKIDV